MRVCKNMKEQYKLSVIIPMYNAELYIGDCLDSILNSDLEVGSYEIVVVNDGSKDKGPNIAREYSEKYPNILYIDQTNQGQSVARNNGIQHCHGEYIWCVDSDDKTTGKLAEVVDLLNQNPNLDILSFGWQLVDEQLNLLSTNIIRPNVPYGEAHQGRELIARGYNPGSVCVQFIRKKLIVDNNLYFYVGITHQDVELSHRLYAQADAVMFTDLAPYIYIIHPNSTSHSINPVKKIKFLGDDVVIIQSYKRLAEKYKDIDVPFYDAMMRRADGLQFGMLFGLYRKRKDYAGLGIEEAVVARMRENGLFPIKTDYKSIKKKLFVKFLNFKFRKF